MRLLFAAEFSLFFGVAFITGPGASYHRPVMSSNRMHYYEDRATQADESSQDTAHSSACEKSNEANAISNGGSERANRKCGDPVQREPQLRQLLRHFPRSEWRDHDTLAQSSSPGSRPQPQGLVESRERRGAAAIRGGRYPSVFCLREAIHALRQLFHRCGWAFDAEPLDVAHRGFSGDR